MGNKTFVHPSKFHLTIYTNFGLREWYNRQQQNEYFIRNRQEKQGIVKNNILKKTYQFLNNQLLKQ